MDNELTKPVGVFKNADNSYKATVWAPNAESVQLLIKGQESPLELIKDENGYWQTDSPALQPGVQYMYLLDNNDKRPDPASMSQPESVHSWSEVVDHARFEWTDASWQPHPMSEMIIYELHVGTFTQEGTFEAIIGKLDHLIDLGINTIEIMPIAQFPGSRNWGYDGVYPFAVQQSYGGVTKLKQLVDKCHQSGIAVILDVVYNHMGPEGNYLADFGPYFTGKYQTPWGSAINFDDAYSDHVRNFFLQNALMWLRDFHFDGLRLDAVHAIMDEGPVHFLKELRMKADQLEKETGKSYALIAESDLNDVKLISDYSKGGYGLQAQWTDDFHHSVHTLITGETDGYYSDFGKPEHLEKSFKQGMVYDGCYSSFRKKRVGTDPSGQPKHQFVICIQNHDQIGNRMMGDRLSQVISFEALKLAAGVYLSAPFVPMLFMGEEWGEDRPFQYFVSHGDADLVKAVQEGRSREFEAFQWKGEVPDPQSETTFNNSKLDWAFEKDDQKSTMFKYYKQMISLRKEGAFDAFKGRDIRSENREQQKVLVFSAAENKRETLAVFNFSSNEQSFKLPANGGTWKKRIASSDLQWGGELDIPESLQSGEELGVPASSLIIFEN